VKRFKAYSVVCWFASALVFCPVLCAQSYVYLNDNNDHAPNLNTATMFKKTGTGLATTLAPSGGIPYATGGTGWAGGSSFRYSALKNQAAFNVSAKPCLFISDPGPSTGYASGDIAVFNIAASGTLTLTGRYAAPATNLGNLYGIALAGGNGYLYAAYSHSKTIATFKATWNGTACILDYLTTISAVGKSGGVVDGMSLSPNFALVVVAYGDGSVQSFKTTTTGLVPTCALAQNSAGFTDGNGGIPAGVDITADSHYAIFGDANNSNTAVAELEVAPIPIPCVSGGATVTLDFGGPIVANSTYLGPGIHSKNVWLSPNGLFIYVTNTESHQITTVAYVEPFGLSLATGCTSGHTNPTLLHPGSYVKPGEIQTVSPTIGTGSGLYVAEYGDPSEVALLAVDVAGCTEETTPSPVPDTSSNYVTQVFGSWSLNAWPPRLF
jgi:hypothetical protein